MIGYNKSTVVFISQLKGAVHPLVLTNQGLQTPPVFISHNLNHVSAFFYSCFVLPRLALAYLSLHLTPLVLLTYQHTWFCLFSIFLFFAPIIVCQTLVSTNFDFEISPPPVLSLTFCFLFISLSSAPLSPFLTYFSQLASPACFVSLCGLCFFAVVRVSRTEEESVRFRPPLSSTAPYPDAESTHV